MFRHDRCCRVCWLNTAAVFPRTTPERCHPPPCLCVVHHGCLAAAAGGPLPAALLLAATAGCQTAADAGASARHPVADQPPAACAPQGTPFAGHTASCKQQCRQVGNKNNSMAPLRPQPTHWAVVGAAATPGHGSSAPVCAPQHLPEVFITRVVPYALSSDEVEVVDLFGGRLAAAGWPSTSNSESVPLAPARLECHMYTPHTEGDNTSSTHTHSPWLPALWHRLLQASPGDPQQFL